MKDCNQLSIVNGHLSMVYNQKSIVHCQLSIANCLGLIVLLCSLILAQPASAQNVWRSVVAAGGGITTDSAFSIHGTASQTAIGRVQSTNEKHLVGFWYTARSIMDKNNGSCVVAMPRQEVFIGSRASIPLLLMDSRNLNSQAVVPRQFEARIRCNATVLEPQNVSSLQRINDEYIFTLKGERKENDTVGVLTQAEFVVKLGDAESTPLVIEDFHWVENPGLLVVKKDGEAIIGGICRGGDTLRLLHRSKKAMIADVFPQPASEQMTIDVVFNEKGMTTIYLADMNGNTVATLLQENISVSARTMTIALRDIPSGSYFLMMRTPNELISRKVIVLK